MNVLKTIVENGGVIKDRGILTLFALDYPKETVIVDWEDGSQSKFRAKAALEAISTGELMGRNARRVWISIE